jgi:hypothetical protein
MFLDAIVEQADMVWLGSAKRKSAHLTALTRIDTTTLPTSLSATAMRSPIRYSPERLPIGIPAGRGVLVFVVHRRSR